MRLSDLEGQQYLCEILLFIRSNEGTYVEEMLRGPFSKTTRPTLYRALRKLEALGLAHNRLEDRSAKGGIKRMWFVTPFGEEMAIRLAELDHLMRSHDKKPQKNSPNHHRVGTQRVDSHGDR